MANKVNVGSLRSGNVVVDGWAARIVEAIRYLDSRFGGIIATQFTSWEPFGRNQPRIWSGFFLGQTTSTTATKIVEFEVPENTVCRITSNVVGASKTGPEGKGVSLAGTFRRVGDTVTQIGTTTAGADHEDDSAWAATYAVSTKYVRVVVTGDANTVNWSCDFVAHEQPFTIAT
jgi:hypothetical protein